MLQDTIVLNTENSISLTCCEMVTSDLVIYPLLNMAIDPHWQNQPKTMGFKSSLSALHICLCVVGLPSHAAVDCVLFSFFRSVNNGKEINSYSLCVSLLVSLCL